MDPQNQNGQEPPKGAPSDEAKMKRLESQITELKAQLEESKQRESKLTEDLGNALTQEDVTKAVEEAKANAEKALNEANAKASAQQKRLLVENELIKANCIDTKGAIAHIDLNSIEIASDGHISGLDIAKLAEDKAHLFQAPNTKKVDTAGNPSGNGAKKLTRSEIAQMKDPKAQREAYAQLLDE